MRRIFSLFLGVFIVTNVLGQGFIDLSSNVIPSAWNPAGALTQSFNTVGTPAINLIANVEGSTSRFINSTPRTDSRGLWLSIDLPSRLQEVTVTFTFSEPVTNLSFGIRGIDRDLSFSNYQDRVGIAGYDVSGAGLTPNISYNTRTAYLGLSSAPFIRTVLGFTPDPFDSTLTTVNYRSGGVKRLVITYGSGGDVRLGPITSQSIFLTDLAWSNIVPVQLIYFRGKAENNRARLNWATATEINSEYFNIERSTDLREFVPIGKVTSAGDSRERLEYSFLDDSPLPGVNYYRLKQVDKDGSFEYSKVIAVSTQSEAAQFVVYPNPSDGQQVKLQFDNLELDGLRLVNMLGQTIEFDIEAASNNSLTIRPKHPLETGVYFVTYASNSRSRVTQKLFVNR